MIQNVKIITDNTHSVYPLCEKELDHVLGIIYAKDLLIAMLKEPDLDLRKYIKKVNIVPSGKKAYQVLEKFKETRIHCGLVVDEFGSIEGIVTINDILDGLVGDITDMDEPEVIKRPDGSWLIDGKLAFFEFIHEFEIEDYDFTGVQFDSIAGFAIYQLKEIPKTGDSFDWDRYHFEIVKMDGNPDRQNPFDKSPVLNFLLFFIMFLHFLQVFHSMDVHGFREFGDCR